ncbi:glycoside hydrolase family 28 [Mucilaginibacter sp. PPCGB 2223]|uniref:glycoside hydrolase family 28 protein n=1 Tax=Mucilaginibacter sp. PPCGB 2223 TaxID=1886027 RepID=UPI000826E71C|nr:glycosyl hydrolase family 28 protein [Mucilaginibacter sp. PPCGB 2223]OCX52283.1 glycoside hydrolase family 28 [Mucilaginibacter sp. PPCGB 2223]
MKTTANNFAALRRKYLPVLVLPFVLATTSFAQTTTYPITRYGAVGDGKTDNTKAIQKAVNTASESGGGTVLVPLGKFVTGVIELKSNIELHFEKGAALLATVNRSDYGPQKASALIVANKAQHVSITGAGTIDGRGDALLKDIYRMLRAGTLKDDEWQTYNPWHQMRPEENNRPHLIDFTGCKDVAVKNITIRDGLCWIQDYRDCLDMVFDNITVISNTFWNNDGIDLVDCKNVKVTNSFFNVADDGVCLKSSDPNSACENIEISHCRIRSSASAFKMGTASFGGFKKIKVHDIEVYDTYRSAVAIETVDGGAIEDIDIRNVNAKNTGNAIFIRLGQRNKNAAPGTLRRVYIGNVRAQVPAGKPDAGYHMEGPPVNFKHHVFPSGIDGIPGYIVQDVTLENIDIAYEGTTAKTDYVKFNIDNLPAIPEVISNYPEFSMFGELPAWGFFVRHAEGINFKNVKLSCQKNDLRTACIFDDVKNLNLDGLHINKKQSSPVVVIKSSTTAAVNVNVAGKQTKDILIK